MQPQQQLPQAPQPDQQGYYTPAVPQTYAGETASQPHEPQAPTSVAWQASEYVHTQKGGAWILGFGAIVVVGAAITIWIQSWTFLALIIVMAAAMGYFAFRPPRTMNYSVSEQGVQINDKTYPFSEFRSFGVLADGAFYTMTLIPIKRFLPATSLYFSEEEGEKIVDVVGGYLPMQQIKPDLIDLIMRRLHF